MTGWQERWWGKGWLMLWGVLTLAYTSVAILLAAPFVGGRRAFHRVGGNWVRLYFPMAGVRMEETGWEQLPEDLREGRRPALFMSTHESNLDPPTLMRSIRVPAVFMSKKELKWVPLVGWAAWAGGTLFIDRGNRERSKLSLKAAARQIREGKTVVVFPEGTRTRTGELGVLKKGVFVLALQADVPVVPVATVGGFQILPAGRLFPRPGQYQVRFGTPLEPQAFVSKEALMEAVRVQLERLRAQALSHQP